MTRDTQGLLILTLCLIIEYTKICWSLIFLLAMKAWLGRENDAKFSIYMHFERLNRCSTPQEQIVELNKGVNFSG